MSNNNNNSNGRTSGGAGLAEILTIIFIVLKLLDIINWSWLWVLSPLWISFVVIGILAVIFSHI